MIENINAKTDNKWLGRGGLALMTILALSFFVFFTKSMPWHPVSGMIDDNDSLIRALRVMTLMETGDWWNATLDRVYPPYGLVQHWTRAVDLMTLIFAAPFAIFTTTQTSIVIASTIIPPLLLVLCYASMLWAFRPLLPNTESRYYLGLLMLFFLPLLAYARPGYIDQHLWLLLHYIILIGFTIRFIINDIDAKSACIAGLTMASGLWFSVEVVHAAAVMLAIMGVTWLFADKEAGVTFRGFARFFAGGMLAFLFIERGPDALSQNALAEFDRISLLYTVPAIVLWGLWESSALIEKKRDRALPLAAKLGLGVLASAICAAAAGHLRPSLLQFQLLTKEDGPDRVYVITRMQHLAESQALVGKAKEGETWAFWVFVSYIFFAPVGMLIAFMKKGDTRKKLAWLVLSLFAIVFWYRSPNFPPRAASYILLPLFGYFSLTLMASSNLLRIMFKKMPSIPPTATTTLFMIYFFLVLGLISSDGEALSNQVSNQLGNEAMTSNTAMAQREEGALPNMRQGAPPFTLAPAALERLGMTEEDVLAAYADMPVNGTCGESVLVPWLQALFPADASAETVMTVPDVAPEILFLTQHNVLSIPNHRRQDGHTLTYNAMHAETDTEALGYMRQSGATVLAFCKDDPSAYLFGSLRPNEDLFANRLYRGITPDWLIRYGAPSEVAHNSFEIYQLAPE